MKFKRIPIRFFPATVLLVDDNQRFLKNISLQLDNYLPYLLFNHPSRALAHLNSFERSTPNKYFFNSNFNNCLNQYTIDLDLTSIHKEIYDADRFKEVSVVVVDYAMPGLNGIQFCEQLKNRHIKKIMMTGEADHQIAVQAFNDGIIDKFILKSDLNLKNILNKCILEMHEKFFFESTESMVHSLESEPDYCLVDPKVVEILNKICQENHFIEYYLLDASGSFLLLDAAGNPSWFIIKSEAELEMYEDFAKDSQAPSILCEQLKSGEKIPYFPEINKCHSVSGSAWDPYLYPAQRIDGKKTYHYAFIKEIKESNLVYQNILSYNAYLNLVLPQSAIC